MKPNRLSLLFIVLIAALLLTACGGAIGASSWPGLAASEDIVYAAYGPSVFAVNAGNGSEVWHFPAEPDNRRTYYAPPMLAGDQLIVADYLNSLHALNPSNGAELWIFDQAKGRFIGGPLVLDDLILAPNSDNNLYALNRNGQLQWSFTTEQGLWARPVSIDDTVYFPSMDHFMYAVSLAGGQQVWKTDMGAASVASPAISEDGMLYAGTLANELLAINTEDGAIAWRVPAKDTIWAAPTYHDGAIYFGDVGGNIFGVDAATGGVLWQMTLDGAVTGAAAATEEGVLFTTEKGQVQAVSFDGQKLWNDTINGKLYSTPVVSGNRVITGVVQGDSLLVAWDANGANLWSFTPASK